MVNERAYWLAWQQIEGVGPHRLKALKDRWGSLRAAWETESRALLSVPGLGLSLVERIAAYRSKTNPLAQAHTWEEEYGPCWTPEDADYPPLLQEIPDTPAVLYYRGPRPAWTPAVAIVGTRTPSDYGLRWAKKLGFELTRAGFLVVSGMATGIDGAAHEGALEAGGATVAVLGCGVDLCYPLQNHSLYQRIRERGIILSEHPKQTPPAKANFPRRNRILAGMTQATVVIEAPTSSGSLITARLAVDYGREVFALPGQVDTPQAQGALSLVSQGAQVVLGIEDLILKLGATPAPTLAAPPPAAWDLTSVEQLVLARLTGEPQALEVLLQQTDLGTGDLTAVLLLLELKGLAAQLAGLRYRRVG
ncbi:DNA-processing protein DprA [Anthocerotibacter panamensis]|uniref:DNA-processing protein DprA n=1 Tax=Anthocerotibacter panamensis TaxID=2857077 RepID=UPI001C406C84|nr:DNA-processing protein DprA [Anthocerotibacter panamensis]